MLKGTVRETNITNRKADFICNCPWTRQTQIPAVRCRDFFIYGIPVPTFAEIEIIV
jgi:hypothetical protein